MSGLTQDTEHSARGVARLIERYRRPRTSALLASWLDEVQEVEDALWQLLVERSLETAEGAQLDVLGAIVGQPRRGMDDDWYRLWISARNVVHRSSGTTSELLTIARMVAPAGTVIRLEEWYPASLAIRMTGDVDLVADDLGYAIANMLHLAKPAGVAFNMTWLMTPEAGAFTFAPLPDTPVLDSPLGFDMGAFAIVTDGSTVPPEIDEPPSTTVPGQIVIQGVPLVIDGVPLVITPPAEARRRFARVAPPIIARHARIVPRPPVPAVSGLSPAAQSTALVPRAAGTIELEDAFADGSLEMTAAGDQFRVGAAVRQPFVLRTQSVSATDFEEIGLLRFDAGPFGGAVTLTVELEVSAPTQLAELQLYNLTAAAALVTLSCPSTTAEKRWAALSLPPTEQLYSLRLRRVGGDSAQRASCRSAVLEATHV